MNILNSIGLLDTMNILAIGLLLLSFERNLRHFYSVTLNWSPRNDDFNQPVIDVVLFKDSQETIERFLEVDEKAHSGVSNICRPTPSG